MWFAGADVCYALGMAQWSHQRAILRMPEDLRKLCQIQYGLKPQWALRPDEKSTHRISAGIQGNPSKVLISESGVYKVVMRSSKPNATAFQDWVTRDVLPSISKNGGYVMGQS